MNFTQSTLTVALILINLQSNLTAQMPLGQGASQLNLGVGLSEWGIPVYGGIDWAVDKDITAGGEISFRSYNENFTGKDFKKFRYNHTIIGFSGNCNYHFNSVLKIKPKWDVYAGLNLGFFLWNSPRLYEGSRSSGLVLAGQLGARYAFSNSFALNVEVGGGNAFSGGKIGATFKL